MDADVVIVGAGPAGIAAAIHLHRAGRGVIVIDKAEFPRDKICGDGLTSAALREFQQLGLEPSDVPSWQQVEDVWVRSPSGVEVCFPLPRDRGTYAAVATRFELDAALVETARRIGVDIREGTALTGAAERLHHIEVDTPGGAISARYVIGADGMWSPLRKALGMGVPDYRGEWHAFRQYFRNVSGRAAKVLYTSFEPDFLPGYFWSFPLAGDRANIGFGIQRDRTHRIQEMGDLWRDLLQRPHVVELLGPDAEPESPHRAWPIPARIDDIELGRGRALFVGDAVAACDPMTGEGIGQALMTGRMAAESIVGSQSGDPSVAQRSYRRLVESELIPDHRMSMLLIRALQHRRGARTAVRVAGATDWTRRNFARWLFEDEPRGIVLTPQRWHRRFLSRPGSY